MSEWRNRYKVHPAADVFPMMDDAELEALGADIKARTLLDPILIAGGWLIDGRNRLEAMERAGLPLPSGKDVGRLPLADITSRIISKNLRRRHLTTEQQVGIIHAVHKAAWKARAEAKADKYMAKREAQEANDVFRQAGEKLSKRGRREGRKPDNVKAAVIADAAKEGISKRAVERVLAKINPKSYAARPTKPQSGKPISLGAARRHYLDLCEDPGVSLDEEQRAIIEAFREIAGKRLAARRGGHA